ncbi:MAG: TIGR03086 family protein [Nocardioides sp.]|nr:TIGR03086 family protein [Nocardioides sp.]
MDTLETFLAQLDLFGAVVEGVDGEGAWTAASPCEEWTAADVLDHVVGTQADFLGRYGVELVREDGEPAQRWAAHDAQVRAALADEALLAVSYDSPFGRTTVGETLHAFYTFDLLVHRWDLGSAADQPVLWTDEEMRLLEASLDEKGDMLYEYGASKPALEVPDDASWQTRLLARLGRAG